MTSSICLDYAIQLEMDGIFGESQEMYKKALETSPNFIAKTKEEKEEHIIFCENGFIKTTFLLGSVAQGMKLAVRVTDKKVLLECAKVLNELKQYNESAQLLERAESWEEAANIYIKLKHWSKVAKLVDSISSPTLFVQLAKSHENEGRYIEAASNYDRAGDWVSLVRVLVDNLQDIESASSLVMKSKSPECAKKLAKIFITSRSFLKAIEFYLIAGMQSEAFLLAKTQNFMYEFAEMVCEDASLTFLNEIAEIFEEKGEYLNAAKYYFQAMKFPQALKAVLASPVDDTAITLAISIIGEAKSDVLTHTLIDFLMGERDGHPKDAKYIFTLYMSNL
jgi:WD repeat-containing protein 19